VSHLSGALGVDTVGTIELIALCLAYAPVGAVWAMTYCIGPGFVVGSGTLVAPSGTSLGDLPAFPLLAALPDEGTPPALALGGLAIPLVAGLLLGLLVARRSGSTSAHAAGVGAGSGALAGVLAGLLAALAHGGLTQGRLSSLGPQPVVVALWTAVELAAVGALTAGVYRWRSLARSPRLAPATAPRTISLLDTEVVVLPDTGPADEPPPDEWPTEEIPRVVDDPGAETAPGDR
jgi:hypothetical protein